MKNPLPYLHHILEECRFLENETRNLTFQNFVAHPLYMHAFVRSLEIIGEAVRHIPEDFRDKYPYIEWKEMVGMRDK